jgi:hypothetical protein
VADAASWQKEQYQKAYVRALTSQAGITIGEWSVDKDGVDVTLRRGGWSVDLQLKCTRRPRNSGQGFVFDLDVPTFAKLADPDRSSPGFIVLMVVPPQVSNWLTHEDKNLVLHAHSYWAAIEPGSVPTSKVTTAVALPRTQRFDVTAMNDMFAAARKWLHTAGAVGSTS